MIQLKMKNCNMILTEKNSIRKKVDKYEFLAGDEILPPDQWRVIEQAMFAYSPLGKTFEKQIKTIEEKGKQKQVETLEVWNPEKKSKFTGGTFSKRNKKWWR